tara:strand:+ start:461 stop:685 length:225 start_codon:yes stop_codon:yes gene_type:complete
MEGKIEASDTGQLNDRLTIVEERVQFNNDSLKEVYGALDRLDSDIAQVEDKLAAWMERELAKVYDIINDNPLGN